MYSKTVWVAGDVITAVKLNNNEDKTSELDTAALQAQGFSSDLAAWYSNTKLGAMFQTDETWSAGTADTTNHFLGTQALRLTEDDNVAGYKLAERTGLSLNFAALNNGEASTTDDYVKLGVYVSNVAKTEKLVIYLGDVSGGNYYSYTILAASLITGKNFINIKKSDFTTTGSPNWNNLPKTQIRFYSTINAINEYVSFQLVQLYKKDPDSAAPNAMQRNGVRDFAQNSGEWFVGLESGEIVWRDLNPAGTTNALQGTKAYTDFIAAMMATTKTATGLRGMTWYVDASNYIRAFVFGDSLYLSITETVAGTVNYTVSLALVANDKMECVLQKSGASVSLIAYKNGNRNVPYELKATTTLVSSLGYLATNDLANNFVNYESLSITTTDHAHHADVAETLTAAGVSALFPSFSDSAPLNDEITASGTLTKTFLLDSANYKHGEVMLESGRYGIHVNITNVNTESFVQGVALSLGTDLFGSAWSRNEKNYITSEHSTGTYTLGYLATGTYAISVDECYINGSNLQLDFVNNSTSSDSLSCDLNFKVW